MLTKIVVDLNILLILYICAGFNPESFGEAVSEFTGISPFSRGSTILVGPCLLINV